MDTPSATGMVSRQYEQALRLLADSKSSLKPTTMTEIARLLVACSDTEKCLAHYVMDNDFIGEDQFLRFHWLLTKSCVPGCMPTDRRQWQELLAIARAQGTNGHVVTRLCSTAGCGGKYRAKGFCRKCYDRANRWKGRESRERWRLAHAEQVRAYGRQKYWRNRSKILRRAAEKRRAAGSLPLAEHVARRAKQSRSGYRGVKFHKPSGLWHASLKHKGKKISLRYHRTKEDAARAYDAKARELFGSAALLNFPSPPWAGRASGTAENRQSA